MYAISFSTYKLCINFFEMQMYSFCFLYTYYTYIIKLFTIILYYTKFYSNLLQRISTLMLCFKLNFIASLYYTNLKLKKTWLYRYFRYNILFLNAPNLITRDGYIIIYDPF